METTAILYHVTVSEVTFCGVTASKQANTTWRYTKTGP